MVEAPGAVEAGAAAAADNGLAPERPADAGAALTAGATGAWTDDVPAALVSAAAVVPVVAGPVAGALDVNAGAGAKAVTAEAVTAEAVTAEAPAPTAETAGAADRAIGAGGCADAAAGASRAGGVTATGVGRRRTAARKREPIGAGRLLTRGDPDRTVAG